MEREIGGGLCFGRCWLRREIDLVKSKSGPVPASKTSFVISRERETVEVLASSAAGPSAAALCSITTFTLVASSVITRVKLSREIRERSGGEVAGWQASCNPKGRMGDRGKSTTPSPGGVGSTGGSQCRQCRLG